jgi:uncharacterized protein involved in type VI secretion and phage assembly
MDFGDLILQQPVSKNRNTSKCFSIVTGIVKENYNENFPGKVLVEMYFGEKGKTSTEWIRVMQPYCGKEFGEYFIPEVGTEIVLGFNLGEINKPIVLGCLWNDIDKLPPNLANQENSIKSIKTKGGHEITFDETKDKEKIQIKTNGKLTVLLEDKESKISIQDENGDNLVSIDSKNGLINVKAKKKIVFNAGDKDMLTLDSIGKKASLTADNIEIKAAQALTLKGLNTNLEGNMTNLKAQGTFKAEAGAMLQIKGTMVKIN